MKNLYFILALSIFLNQLKAQEWFPIGAKWYYDGAMYGYGNPSAAYVRSECVKDTTVEGVSCRKIASTYSNLNNTNAPLEPTFLYHTNDSVMVYYQSRHKFSLLYKFNVQAGDTLTYDTPYMDTTFHVVVDSVSQLALNGNSLKQVFTHPLTQSDMGFGYHMPYVERLGGLNWLFAMGPYFNGSENGPLRCYSDASIQYKSGAYSCDYIFGASGIEELPGKRASLYIYPNPATNALSVKLDYAKLSSSETTYLKIIDQLGQEVYKLEISPYSNESKIDISQLPQGIYHLCLISNQGIVTGQKFVKE